MSKRAQTGIPHSFSLNGRVFVYAAFIYSNSAQVMDSPNAVQIESYAGRNAVRPRTSSLQEFTVAPVAPTLRPVCASRRKRDGGMYPGAYPSPACKESQVLQLVHGSVHGLPIIFLTSGMGTESIAALTAEGSFEYVEQGRLAQ